LEKTAFFHEISQAYALKENWEKVNVGIIFDAVLAKFLAYPNLTKNCWTQWKEKRIPMKTR
jgi:predicted NAD-dependent protein-ADP-ribosyltransferase YbiA (DUF1768 family)